ncbi:HpcH/HpaI aldolase/citrate lyase family protein [Sphingomonas sp. PvP018]|uniref:HpcH/HpaI aldolase/citrate lyase family protein n=1 Tax=Sphingomonas sp. PvP018 TaxID=2817852 RepID=UPI001AE4C511|nr:HpcH/HpaI aldolase/citrate lyase family protein [Sphingomonas sp. PvP018]MBP2513791.1 citrate lyase beta subunit [Sphingomonas sp. PvP018]
MNAGALSLGATLYMPCTRTDLAARLFGSARIPDLRSVVLCLEDAVLERDLPTALMNLAGLLRTADARGRGPADPMIFVRPRDAAMLARILLMPGVGCLTGYVLPKANADTLPSYLALSIPEGQMLMPTLETREACDPYEMRRLRDQLLAVQDRILALRIGGNDLMQSMGLRRPPGRTAYDGPLGTVIAMLVATFSPWGFSLSAPVMERFGDTALLRREVARDIDHGLLTKTAIHPDQIAIIQTALAVPACDVEEARLILDPAGPAVFAQGGVMCEPATHRVWAERLIARAEVFGVVDGLPLYQRA